jgi:hypothetical protein
MAFPLPSEVAFLVVSAVCVLGKAFLLVVGPVVLAVEV